MKVLLFVWLMIASVASVYKPLGDSMFMSAGEESQEHKKAPHTEKMVGFNSFSLPKQSLIQLGVSKSIKKFDIQEKENKDEIKEEVHEEVREQTKKDVDRGDGAMIWIIITIVFIVIILLLILLCHCGWCGADKALQEKKEKEKMQEDEEKRMMMEEEAMAMME